MTLHAESMRKIGASEQKQFVGAFEKLHSIAEESESASVEMRMSWTEDDAVESGGYVPEIIVRVRKAGHDLESQVSPQAAMAVVMALQMAGVFIDPEECEIGAIELSDRATALIEKANAEEQAQ